MTSRKKNNKQRVKLDKSDKTHACNIHRHITITWCQKWDRLNPPESLQLQGNVADNWKRFKQAFLIYQAASGLDSKNRKVQSMTLLHIIGTEALDIYNTFHWAADECNDFQHCNAAADFHVVDCILKKFDTYCAPKKNITIERHIFFSRNQNEGETFDVFVTDLKLKAKSCEFGELKEALIKDRIVGGVHSDHLRTRLLREADLTLTKAQDICRAAEASEAQVKIMKDDVHVVNAVKAKSNKETAADKDTPPTIKQCFYCGKSHQQRKCPAYGQTCKKCGKKNHFSAVCKSSSVKMVAKAACSQSTPDIEDATENEDIEFFVSSIDQASSSSKEWTIVVNVHGHRITFTLDTGAQVNILPYSLFRKLKNTKLQKSRAHLTTYNGECLHVKGQSQLTCMTSDKEHLVEFQIVDTRSKPILGLPSCEALNLIQRVDVIEDETLSAYADVFKGLGNMKDEYTIRIDSTVSPVVHAARKVPAALRDDLQKELQHMEKERVIEKVDHPTDWVNSLVIVQKKGGGLRLCLDPRDLNRAVRREHYQLPTIEEIASRQSGNKVFSVLDANSAFWQIRLNQNSSDLTCFNTPFGRYKFLRLPFDLNSSAEVFAKRFHQAFENIPGVETYMDEMLIGGRTNQEHDWRLTKVLETAREAGIKLKPSKCSLRVNEVKFIGHTITQNGLKPDDCKIQAIQDMPSPSSRKELERFLGMVNYLGKFIPNLSDVTAPLRDLLKQDIVWQWLPQHENALLNLKKLVTQAPVLAFYDANKPVLLSVDASQDGLGAVLIQDGRPVAYASRSLTDCEKRYANIEKEMLAVVFGVEHYHYYVYGRPVTIESDHKPLESIIKKPLSAAPPRLQRMLFRLMKYTVQLVYKAGKDMSIPDTLSRAALPCKTPASDDWEAQVHLIIDNLPISDEKLKLFQQETAKDAVLQLLRRHILEGWPDHKKDAPEEIRAYTGFRDELSEKDGLIFKGEQLIVPKSLQSDMLQRLHQGHMGRDKCLATAKQVFFWIGMSVQITDLVTRCAVCKKFQNAQQKEPLMSHVVPSLPWEKLAADLFQFDGKNYLLIVDYYSKFCEVSPLKESTRSADVILAMKSQFARHGIPKELITDNGPQFSCTEFARFVSAWDFRHMTSSPKYPRSNGLAERNLRTIKNE